MVKLETKWIAIPSCATPAELYHLTENAYKERVDYYNDKHWRKQLSHRRSGRSKRPFVFLLIILLLTAGIATSWWFISGQRAAAPSPATTHSATEKTLLDGMSLRDKVASLFMFHTPSTDPQVLAAYYQKYKPAGLIFMDDNIPATREAMQAETAALKTASKLPPLIAIDEEGDSVKRLNADTFPGALTLADLPPSAAKNAFSQRSDLLKSFGFNLNFGIIADVTDNPNSYIFPRVLGTTPQAAADRVAAAVEGSKNRTLTTLKHFPGHGETTDNSHVSIPTAQTTMADWQTGPALPFKAGIDAGADFVMFGQLRYSAVDTQPATLSATWHQTLRDKLGFKGLAITDDMIMLLDSGNPDYADPVANAVAALKAGNDIVLYVLDHNSDASQIDPDTLIDGVVAAVKDGQLSQSVIDRHARAVLSVRQELADR